MSSVKIWKWPFDKNYLFEEAVTGLTSIALISFIYQILLAGDVVPEEKVKDLVAGVNLADVNAAAKKLSNAKLSMAAVGNLSTVPYLDSL